MMCRLDFGKQDIEHCNDALASSHSLALDHSHGLGVNQVTGMDLAHASHDCTMRNDHMGLLCVEYCTHVVDMALTTVLVVHI